VKVPNPITMSSCKHEQYRYHLHVTQPKLEIDVYPCLLSLKTFRVTMNSEAPTVEMRVIGSAEALVISSNSLWSVDWMKRREGW